MLYPIDCDILNKISANGGAMNQSTGSARMQFILAGIGVIEECGISGFTMRKLASRCGVSIAAPYRHFKDKDELIFAIISYINEQWYELQNEVIQRYENDLRRQLIEISMEYIRFLLHNPHFRHIITMRSSVITPEQQRVKAQISHRSRVIIDQYCKSVNMSDERRRLKTFIVRSIIYGAAIMMDNGELENDEATFYGIREAISREFDLT